MIKIKLKPDGSTWKGNSLTEKYLVLTCNPLISATLAEKTARRPLNIEIGRFQTFISSCALFKKSCVKQKCYLHMQRKKKHALILEVLNESKSERSPPKPRGSLESRRIFS